MAVRQTSLNFIPGGLVTIAIANNTTLGAVDITISATARDQDIVFTDITTNNASTSKHGFLRKLDNNSAHFLDGTGAWSTPASFDPSTQVSGWMPLSTVVGGEAVLVYDGTDELVPTYGPF